MASVINLYQYLPGLEVSSDEILEAELLAQQLLSSNFPDIDLREGTAARDMVIRPNATLLAMVKKGISLYFAQNTIVTADDNTNTDFVDKLLSNWFLTRIPGNKAVISARLFFAKAKSISVASDTFFSTDNVKKFYPSVPTSYPSTALVFDSASNSFYIDIDLIAEQEGVTYNVTAGSLLYFSNFDPYFLHAEINFLRQLATNTETNTQFIARAKSSISTRNLINDPSITSNLQAEFPIIKNVYNVGYGDPEMIRDSLQTYIPAITGNIWFHNGGKVDTYNNVPLTSGIVQLLTDGSGNVKLTGPVYKFARSAVSGGDNADTIPFYQTQAVTSITRSGTTATVTTTASHGYTSGDSVTILHANQTGYNLTATVTVTGANTFTYTVANTLTTPATGTILAGIPFPYTWSNTNVLSNLVTAITRSSTTVTVNLPLHGLAVGERVTISGASQTQYNGTFVVSTITDVDNFTYEIATAPATPATGTIHASFVDRYNEVGFSSRQSLSLVFGGPQANSTVSFTIYYYQDMDQIQTYLEDKANRVLCADILSRGFNLTTLSFTVIAYNGPVPDITLTTDTIKDYLASLGPGETLIMADLQSKLYAAGITGIQNPVTTTWIKYWKDMMGTTSGTVTDYLDPHDSLNIFVVDTVTVNSQVIV